MKLTLDLVKNIFYFYKNGFVSMRLGRILWSVIIIKLLIMFAFLKPLFFPKYLSTLPDDNARSEVIENSFKGK